MGLLDLLTDFGRTQQQGVGLRPGTAGFNPDAPDPRGVGLEAPPQGGFLGPPQGSSPPPRATEPDPRDLSQLPTLQKIGLLLSATSAGMRGQRSPIEELIEQRQRQAELRTAQRRQAFVQNLELLDKFRGFLDTVPISERPQRAAQLRQRYEQEFGGPSSGEFFDAVLGDPDNAAGITGQLADDPEIQAVLADPRATLADVRRVRETPEFLQRAAERQDAALLPVVKGKLQKLLGAQNPTMRDAIQRAQKDGVLTPVEIRELNELAGEGPEGFRLTSGELATLDRQQSALAAEIPGFQPTTEFQAKRKTTLDLEKKLEETRIETEGRLREIREQARLRPPPSAEGPTAPQKANVVFRTESARKAYTSKDSAIRSALENPPSGTNDILQLMTLISQIDGTAAREGEVDTQRDTQSALGRLQGIVDNLRAGAAYGPQKRAEVREILENMRIANQQAQQSWATRMRTGLEYAGFDARQIVPEAFEAEEAAPGGDAPAGPTPEGAAAEIARRRGAAGGR